MCFWACCSLGDGDVFILSGHIWEQTSGIQTIFTPLNLHFTAAVWRCYSLLWHCCWAAPRTQKRATVRARGQCELEPPHAHAAQTWEVAWVFYLRHADIITEQVIIKLFSYQQTKPCDLVYKRSQPTRAAAHRGTFMQMRHTFPHPELDTNSHSLQTHIRKHKCTKRAHTRRYCSLSIPNPDDRAAPPHNNLFMKSKNVSRLPPPKYTRDTAGRCNRLSQSEIGNAAKEYSGGGELYHRSPRGP